MHPRMGFSREGKREKERIKERGSEEGKQGNKERKGHEFPEDMGMRAMGRLGDHWMYV